MPIDYNMYSVNPTALSEPTKYNSFLSPPTKRIKVVSSIKINDRISNSSLCSGNVQMNPHESFNHSGDSSRMNNIRCVSESSFQINSTVLKRKIESTQTNYVNNTDSGSINHRSFKIKQAVVCSISSCSSSIVSLSRICEAIKAVVTEIGADLQAQQRIANQCFCLATWTRSNDGSYFEIDARPKGTTHVTVYQVALTIASHDGINILLNAMKAHLYNVEIQEYGCTVLGNVLSILYRRQTSNVLPCKTYLNDEILMIGNSIFAQVFCAMQNHPRNVAVHCAAITALQQYYQSILVFQPNDVVNEELKQSLLHAQQMFLPLKIRQILQRIVLFVEQCE
jgi:hypothetical protein